MTDKKNVEPQKTAMFILLVGLIVIILMSVFERPEPYEYPHDNVIGPFEPAIGSYDPDIDGDTLLNEQNGED